MVTKWKNRELTTGFVNYTTGFVDLLEYWKFGWKPYSAVVVMKRKYDTAAEWLNSLVTYVAKVGNSRSYYAEHLQPTFSILAALVFNGGKDALMTGFGHAADNIDYKQIALLLNSAEVTDWLIPDSQVQASRKLLKGMISDKLQIAYEIMEQNGAISSDELRTLKNDAGYMADFLYELFFQDYRETGAMRIGTLVRYMSELFDVHDMGVVLGYLQARDPNYSSSDDQVVQQHEFEFGDSLPEGATVEIFTQFSNDSSGGGYRIGTVTKEGLKFDNSQFEKDFGDLISCISNDAGQKLYVDYDAVTKLGCSYLTLRVTMASGKTGDVSVNYTNANSTKMKTAKSTGWIDPTQDFEQQAITLTSDNALIITCQNDSVEAQATKSIPLKLNYMTYDADATGHYRTIDSSTINPTFDVTENGDAISFNSGSSFYAGRSYDFTVSGLGIDSKAVGIYKQQFNEDGTPAMSDGVYVFDHLSESSNLAFDATYADTVYNYTVIVSDEDVQKTNFKACMEDLNSGLSEKRASGITVEDVSRGQTATSDNSGWIDGVDFAVGDLIKVTIGSADVGYRFLKWRFAVDASTPFENSDNVSKTIYFYMPDHNVELHAYFTKADSESSDMRYVDISTTAGWAVGMDVEDCGWKAVYTEGNDAYLVYTSKVFTGMSQSSGKGQYAYLQAAEYSRGADMTMYKFKEWRVVYNTQSEGAVEVGDIARKVTGDAENGYVPVEGSDYCPNGSTDLILCLSNEDLKEDVTAVPIYEPVKYSYTITLSNGEVLEGESLPWTWVEVKDVLPEDCTLQSWSVYNDRATYDNADANGGLLETITLDDEATESIWGVSEGKLVFEVMSGPVRAYANTVKNHHTVTVESGGYVSGDTTQFAPGDTVTLKVQCDPTETVTGWTVVEDGSTLDAQGKDTSGSGLFDTFTFTMPDHDITLRAITESNVYTLNYYNATVTLYDKSDSESTLEGTGSADVSGGKVLCFKPYPAQKEGTEPSFVAVAEDGEQISYSTMPDGSIYVQMPLKNATIGFVLETDVTVNTGLVYNGQAQVGVAAGQSYTLSVPEGGGCSLDQSGNAVATNAGTYKVTAKLKEGYRWSDGTTGDKTITWAVAKAPQQALTLSCDEKVSQGDSIALSASGGDGDGAITYTVKSASGWGEAEVQGASLVGVTSGIVIVTATKAGDANHGAVTSAPMYVRVVSDDDEAGYVVVSGCDELITGDADVIDATIDASDWAHVERGYSITVSAAVEDITDGGVSDPVKEEVAQAASGYTVEQYFDISLLRTMTHYEDGQIVKVDEENVNFAGKPLTFKLKIADSLVNTDSSKVRTYKVIARHVDGEDSLCQVIPATYDADTQTVTFESSEFSLFAIAYQDTDVPVPDPDPDPTPDPDPDTNTNTNTNTNVVPDNTNANANGAPANGNTTSGNSAGTASTAATGDNLGTLALMALLLMALSAGVVVFVRKVGRKE